MEKQKKRMPVLLGALKSLLMAPGLLYIILCAAMLIAIMIGQSFGFFQITGDSGFTLQYWQSFFDRQFVDSLIYSLKTGILSSVLALCICYPLAVMISKSRMQKTLLALMKIPMFIPALVASFLLLNLVDYNGFINFILTGLGIVKEPLRMRNDKYAIGVICIQIWKNVPTQLIIMYSAVLSIRKDITDAAHNLGCRGLSYFIEIMLPMTISSALVAILLVFIGVFGDFAISSTAGPVYPNTLSSLLQMKVNLFYDWGQASCIGVVMVAVAIMVICLYTYLSRLLMRAGG